MVEILIGFLLGVFLTMAIVRYIHSGTLKVYIPDDPDEPPYLYAELSKSVGFVCKSKYVLFKVDVRNITSQK